METLRRHMNRSYFYIILTVTVLSLLLILNFFFGQKPYIEQQKNTPKETVQKKRAQAVNVPSVILHEPSQQKVTIPEEKNLIEKRDQKVNILKENTDEKNSPEVPKETSPQEARPLRETSPQENRIPQEMTQQVIIPKESSEAKNDPDEMLQAPRSPFLTYINGVGIVEPKSGNIYVGIPFHRIVKQINVSVNDKVKKGDPLFELDDKDLIANLRVKLRQYDTALAHLHKLEAMPQQEDLIIAEESLRKAQVALNESKTEYEMVTNLPNPRAISKEEQNKRLYKYQHAEADLREKFAQLEKIKSGTWKPDLKIALYEAEQAKADVEAIETEIDRTTIKSPIDGTVLQIKIHEGETVSSDPSKVAMILGNTNELYLRVSVDQFNASFLPSHASAVAFRQGDHSNEFPLEFIHVEPLMIPKKYLTNAVDEKVDTQVFEILYRIAKKDSRLFIGEQMDVFIDIEKK